MSTRDEIFSGTKEIDQKLDFNHKSLSVYLKSTIKYRNFRNQTI